MQQNRYREAIAELESAIEKDDRNMRARYMLAQCYAITGENQKAILHARQIVKYGHFSPEVPEAKVRKLLAHAFENINNLTDAKNEYLILTTLEPNNFENFFRAGEIFFRSNVQIKAMKFLQKASQLNNKHAESLALLGQCQYQMGAYQEARSALLKVTQLKSDHYVAHYFLGLCLRYLGDLDWAIKEFDLAEKDQGLKAKALLAKGMALIDQNNFIRAAQELDRGLQYAAPKSETAINLNYLVAMAYEKNREIPEAIKYWETVEIIKPGYRDVREKLKQYQEFRTDDSIKDFMISGNAQFESIVRRMVEGMGYSITELRVRDDSVIEMVTSEKETQQRNARKQHTMFIIQRNMDPVRENQVRELHEHMRTAHTSRGFIMTTGEITPAAVDFASSRPIELVDSTGLAQYLKKADVS